LIHGTESLLRSADHRCASPKGYLINLLRGRIRYMQTAAKFHI